MSLSGYVYVGLIKKLIYFDFRDEDNHIMIYSMTAYARLEKTEGWVIALGKRSVNQRYLECQVRLPEAFDLEPVVREKFVSVCIVEN